MLWGPWFNFKVKLFCLNTFWKQVYTRKSACEKQKKMCLDRMKFAIIGQENFQIFVYLSSSGPLEFEK